MARNSAQRMILVRRFFAGIVLGLCISVWCTTPRAAAQEAVLALPPEAMEQLQKLPPEQRAKAMEQFRNMRNRGRGGGKPPEAKKPDEKKDDKNKEEKKEEPKEESAKTVKRSTEPPAKVNRDELKVRPDENGYVQFSFYGQRWEDVLQWYADVAKLSFDWQELPEGYLNLTARRKYTLAETGDMLNARLLARGFTLVKNGEVLSVYKIGSLDPSLIPRVDPDDLEDYSPHDFVRVRFDLPESMDPAKAAEDVKILLSPNAKVQPLLATKRLHVIDTVVNLRNVRDLVYSEQMAEMNDVRPREFPIRFRRADYIADQVMIVLGLDPASRKSPQELQIEQQRIQLAMQMMKQNKDVSGMVKKGGPAVFIGVNQRRNTVHVNAPPKEMRIIEQTIRQFDVPDDGGMVASTDELVFRKYVTATASTDAVVSALKEIGRLHPLTQLQSDKPNRTIYATATMSDHEKIQGLIDKLDGSGRQLYVIWLNSRSPADQIAGSIQLLMGEEEEKKNTSYRSRYRSYGWGGYGEEEADQGKMKIQPDIENARLLLWATEAEHEEVIGFLERIGALANSRGGNQDTVRVLEGRDPGDLARLLERLQDSWAGDNPIEIHGVPLPEVEPEQPQQKTPNEDADDEEPVKDKLTGTMGSGIFRTAVGRDRPAAVVQLIENVQRANEAGQPADRAQPRRSGSKPPPIKITVTPDGRLVITSDDPSALDRLEDLLDELEPPAPDFVEYRLENTRASLVDILLKEYFEDELKGQRETVYNEWGEYSGTREKQQSTATLGKRRLLRFIWDNDSNTIIVQNASPAQLKVIDKLIEIYDRPVGEDSVAARKTEVVPILYSNAQDIATSLKEVYRDLLSSKDKEFQGRDGEAKSRTETHYRIYGGGGGDSDSNKKSAPIKMAFEGALSIGVDEISNTLIISAQEQVFDNVLEIVKQLDLKARPDTIVQVHEIRPGVSLPAADLKKALAEALSQPWPGGKPPKKAAQGDAKQGEGEAPPQNEGRRSRRRDR